MQVSVDTTLTEDHNGNIEILADNVTLDCSGHRVIGIGSGRGITVEGRTGVAVRNCHVVGFEIGLSLEEADGAVIVGNSVANSVYTGIAVSTSDGSILENNTVSGTDGIGFTLGDSSQLTVSGNTVTGSRVYGMLVRRTNDSAFSGNHVSDSGSAGFYNEGTGNTFTGNDSHGARADGGLGFDDRFAVGPNTYTKNYCTGNPAGGSRPYGLCQEEKVGLVDTATGEWHLWRSMCSDDPLFGCLEADSTESFYYGNPGDVPFMGDWDCDTVATPGLFRTSDAFAYLRNSNTQGIADIRFFFGNPSDIPLAGDFNGDGCDTLSIYRPSEARFYIINKLGENEGGLGAAEYSFLFGNPGDKPVVGDWDGDGIDEIGLHRESTGFFYYRNTLTTGIADGQFYFGDPGDRFVSGDWGVVDGVDTPAMFRPSNTTFYFRYTLTQGNADSQFVWPGAGMGWLPVSGDFNLT